MDKNTFSDSSLNPGDIVVCTGVSIGAPKGIIGKAFILDPSFMFFEPCLYIDGNDCHYYTGARAKWRAIRTGDGQRPITTLVQDWDTDELMAKVSDTTVLDILTEREKANS